MKKMTGFQWLATAAIVGAAVVALWQPFSKTPDVCLGEVQLEYSSAPYLPGSSRMAVACDMARDLRVVGVQSNDGHWPERALLYQKPDGAFYVGHAILNLP